MSKNSDKQIAVVAETNNKFSKIKWETNLSGPSFFKPLWAITLLGTLPLVITYGVPTLLYIVPIAFSIPLLSAVWDTFKFRKSMSKHFDGTSLSYLLEKEINKSGFRWRFFIRNIFRHESRTPIKIQGQKCLVNWNWQKLSVSMKNDLLREIESEKADKTTETDPNDDSAIMASILHKNHRKSVDKFNEHFDSMRSSNKAFSQAMYLSDPNVSSETIDQIFDSAKIEFRKYSQE